MKLLAFLMQTGGHIAGWRHPRAATAALTDIDYFTSLARTAERGLFDAVFFADYLGFPKSQSADVFAGLETPKLDPLLILSAAAAVTSQVGLIATASTTYNEPFGIARRFATLDHLSKGRAGWNIVTSTMEHEAHNHGQASHMAHGDRYRRAAEFVDVARKLWDSWGTGAMLADKASGRFTDTDRLSAIKHVGEHFRVEGPSTVPRSPQGHPVLVQAGASADGKAFAASCAEVIFTSHPSIETARAFREEMHDLLAQFGRDAGSLKIMPAITPVIGKTREEAASLKRELDDLIPLPIALDKLERLLGGLDLSAYDPDGPMPPLPPALLEGQNSTRDRVVETIVRERPTIRALALQVAGGRTSRTSGGTASDIADELQQWYESGAADGFVISPPFLPGGLEDFVDEVVPELQRRGLFRTAYEGVTLRDRLGLAQPESRFDSEPGQRLVPEVWDA